MIGAQDCVFDQIGKPVPPPPPSSSKPFCNFDPPVGCRAVCVDIGEAGFTPQCGDIGASTLTVQFRNAVGDYIQKSVIAGEPLCPPGSENLAITPCAIGITPQPNPPESQDFCMNPLPGCVQ